MATKDVIEFLQRFNRPISVNNIVQNLPRHAKGAVEKSLGKLVSSQKVKEKIYGEEKGYFIAQTCSGSDKEDMLSLDRSINDLSLEVNAKGKGEQSIAKKNVLKRNLEDAEMELDPFEDTELGSDDAMNVAKQKYQKHLAKFKKRRRICMETVNAILAKYPKSKRRPFEDVGSKETEEDDFNPDDY